MSNFKHKRIKSRKHRMFVASLPCLCGRIGKTQAAHVRKNNGGGMGFKPDDSCTVPLCCSNGLTEGCHDKQGSVGEEVFWMLHGGTERATALAKDLFKHTGDEHKANELMVRFKNGVK